MHTAVEFDSQTQTDTAGRSTSLSARDRRMSAIAADDGLGMFRGILIALGLQALVVLAGVAVYFCL